MKIYEIAEKLGFENTTYFHISLKNIQEYHQRNIKPLKIQINPETV